MAKGVDRFMVRFERTSIILKDTSGKTECVFNFSLIYDEVAGKTFAQIADLMRNKLEIDKKYKMAKIKVCIKPFSFGLEITYQQKQGAHV